MANRNEATGSGRVGVNPKGETPAELIERHDKAARGDNELGDCPKGLVTHSRKIANLPPAFGTPTALTPDQANNAED